MEKNLSGNLPYSSHREKLAFMRYNSNFPPEEGILNFKDTGHNSRKLVKIFPMYMLGNT